MSSGALNILSQLFVCSRRYPVGDGLAGILGVFDAIAFAYRRRAGSSAIRACVFAFRFLLLGLLD